MLTSLQEKQKKKRNTRIVLIIEFLFYFFIIMLIKTYSFNQSYLTPIAEVFGMTPINLTDNVWVRTNYTYYPNRYYLKDKLSWNWESWVTNYYGMITIKKSLPKLEREKVLYHELTHYNVDKLYAVNKNNFRKKFNHLANLFVKWDTFMKNFHKQKKHNINNVRFVNYIRRTIVLLQMWLYKSEFAKWEEIYVKALNLIFPIPFTKKTAMTNELMAYQASFPLDKQLINNEPVFLNDMSWKEIYCNTLTNDYLKDFCYTIDWLNSQIWKRYKKSK